MEPRYEAVRVLVYTGTLEAIQASFAQRAVKEKILFKNLVIEEGTFVAGPEKLEEPLAESILGWLSQVVKAIKDNGLYADNECGRAGYIDAAMQIAELCRAAGFTEVPNAPQ